MKILNVYENFFIFEINQIFFYEDKLTLEIYGLKSCKIYVKTNPRII